MSFPAPGLLRQTLQTPFWRALLLSLALHLALLGLIQVAPVQELGTETVIEVRLQALGPGPSSPAPPAALTEPLVRPTAPSKPEAATAPVPEPAQTAAPLAETSSSQPAAKAEPERPPMAVPSMLDMRWYGAREVDSHPRALSPIEPVYPEAARRRGQTGWVKLRLKIDEFGVVQAAEVVEAAPVGVFETASVQAFGQARFEPARRQGRPVRYEGYFKVVFELD